jgi:hypothetical protein
MAAMVSRSLAFMAWKYLEIVISSGFWQDVVITTTNSKAKRTNTFFIWLLLKKLRMAGPPGSNRHAGSAENLSAPFLDFLTAVCPFAPDYM